MKRGEEGKEKVLESFLHMGQEVPRDAWGRLDSRWGGRVMCWVGGKGRVGGGEVQREAAEESSLCVERIEGRGPSRSSRRRLSSAPFRPHCSDPLQFKSPLLTALAP